MIKLKFRNCKNGFKIKDFKNHNMIKVVFKKRKVIIYEYNVETVCSQEYNPSSYLQILDDVIDCFAPPYIKAMNKRKGLRFGHHKLSKWTKNKIRWAILKPFAAKWKQYRDKIDIKYLLLNRKISSVLGPAKKYKSKERSDFVEEIMKHKYWYDSCMNYNGAIYAANFLYDQKEKEFINESNWRNVYSLTNNLTPELVQSIENMPRAMREGIVEDIQKTVFTKAINGGRAKWMLCLKTNIGQKRNLVWNCTNKEILNLNHILKRREINYDLRKMYGITDFCNFIKNLPDTFLGQSKTLKEYFLLTEKGTDYDSTPF